MLGQLAHIEKYLVISTKYLMFPGQMQDGTGLQDGIEITVIMG